ncbi:GNAT family N-acetyltransferase [Nocardia sp. XZ_19_385]|uniref:GNAT family N-acetyltransferase n=1 Tax=Nocardia sp. XZ_19_385 TaxID=2769488 RepID=UPI002814BDF0|nr:GNAT family N-acetyltransferase [Nocardia sp. XZ_19_385]
MPQSTESLAPEQRGSIVVEPMSTPADAQAFKEINEEWIRAYFSLEPADSHLLDNPEIEIVAKGGQVLIARDGAEIVGCGAVVPEGHGVYEISKMGVSPQHRGRGIGRLVLAAAIDYARAQGATTLYLESSKRLANAVHLYESVGFVHVPPGSLRQSPYSRADVFMKYDLTD